MGQIELILALMLIEIIEEHHFLISLADVRAAIFAHNERTNYRWGCSWAQKVSAGFGLRLSRI